MNHVKWSFRVLDCNKLVVSLFLFFDMSFLGSVNSNTPKSHLQSLIPTMSCLQSSTINPKLNRYQHIKFCRHFTPTCSETLQQEYA